MIKRCPSNSRLTAIASGRQVTVIVSSEDTDDEMVHNIHCAITSFWITSRFIYWTANKGTKQQPFSSMQNFFSLFFLVFIVVPASTMTWYSPVFSGCADGFQLYVNVVILLAYGLSSHSTVGRVIWLLLQGLRQFLLWITNWSACFRFYHKYLVPLVQDYHGISTSVYLCVEEIINWQSLSDIRSRSTCWHLLLLYGYFLSFLWRLSILYHTYCL